MAGKPAPSAASRHHLFFPGPGETRWADPGRYQAASRQIAQIGAKQICFSEFQKRSTKHSLGWLMWWKFIGWSLDQLFISTMSYIARKGQESFFRFFDLFLFWKSRTDEPPLGLFWDGKWPWLPSQWSHPELLKTIGNWLDVLGPSAQKSARKTYEVLRGRGARTVEVRYALRPLRYPDHHAGSTGNLRLSWGDKKSHVVKPDRIFWLSHLGLLSNPSEFHSVGSWKPS